MKRPFVALTVMCTVTFTHARTIHVVVDDPLKDRVAEVITLFGEPLVEVAGNLPRVSFTPNALLFGHICYPAATGRDGTRLGGPVDPGLLGPRPAIECIGIDQSAVNIGFALSRASHIQPFGPLMVKVMRGSDILMTLRLLD